MDNSKAPDLVPLERDSPFVVLVWLNDNRVQTIALSLCLFGSNGWLLVLLVVVVVVGTTEVTWL